ncbi:MAG: 4Fe-4S dicluster domain-containing protein [Candidatus Omnitrophota bacterium]
MEKSKSKDLYAATQESPRPQARIKVETAADANIPMQCRQCEDAPCLNVCPSKAITRNGNEQPVLIDEEKCVGCKMCIVACPSGVIAMDTGNKVAVKCDLCFDRLNEDKIPACVLACPTNAIQFQSSEASSLKGKKYLVTFKNAKK